jgi:hypothetical protein
MQHESADGARDAHADLEQHEAQAADLGPRERRAVDFRGTLGVSRETPVGFADIRLNFDLDTDATPEQLDTLLRLTERYCVVYQTLQKAPPVAVAMNGVTRSA